MSHTAPSDGFSVKCSATTQEVAALVGGRLLSGSGDAAITGFASLRDARKGEISFFTDVKHAEKLRQTQAAVVLVPETMEGLPEGIDFIGVASPSKAFDLVVETFGPPARKFKAGVHPTAAIGENVVFDPEKVSIGPHAVVEEGAELAEGVEIGAGCFVGAFSKIGRDSRLFPGATVHERSLLGERVILHTGVVIGADGFGYEFEGGRHRKVRQSGIVQIDSDVEIGANTTVDRARFGRTWIGEGTKIDNLVQIGHNVVIGKHCIFVAYVAVAGSAVIEDYVVVAAQSGIGGHITVGKGCTLGARSGVTKDLPPGGSYLGFPARPAREEQRRLATVNRLPELGARVSRLEKRVDLGNPEA
jgi:UDP-3-O-[3-hydroxymyristoyl] glucosamine N-acyltransferase